MTKTKIIIQDKDNYGDVLGILSVIDENKTQKEVFEEVTERFNAYEASTDAWTLDGFLDELKKDMCINFDREVYTFSL